MKEAIALFNLDPYDIGINNSFNWSEDPNIFGYVYFKQKSKNSPVVTRVKIYNLPEGEHGMHVHENELTESIMKYKDCCKKLGGHFNPTNEEHGNHAGDLCFNINSINGEVVKKFNRKTISLYEGKLNIIGRSLVIHKDRDDMGTKNPNGVVNEESLITGNAGSRIACSNIISF
jgi:superoxide dismutase, Cu-Zn family